MTPYIAHRRYRGSDMFGRPINIPYGSLIEAVKEDTGTVLYFTTGDNKVPVCYSTSDVAFDYFARNDDGDGLIRGKTTVAIKKRLEFQSADTQETWKQRWDLVWDSPLCQKYRKTNIADHWIWNYDFYNAPLLVLNQIASLVGAKKGK